MLLQPLKLRLKSCILPFLANIIISVVIISLNELLIHEYFINQIFVISEFVFTFFYGLYNYSTLSKTYSSLKHDKHYFFLSSLIVNILNALIMLLIFALLKIFAKRDLLNFWQIAILLYYFSTHLLLFSLGSFYSLFLKKYKALNILFLVLSFVLVVVIFNTKMITILDGLFRVPGGCIVYFTDDSNLLFAVLNIILLIVVSIFNNLKYKKA